ncbi:MAG TPA: hypothetical protein VK209_10000 [Candidatus Sulfotelmatobacter sp.]|nr:hypothetical protein [Candidatus Sulfotelmatobacter sp.]
MNYNNKSRKGLLAVTTLTIVSIASVAAVYAVMIGTFQGGEVTIGGGATGAITYSTDQSTWSTLLSPASVDAVWYSKLNINGGQFSGSAVQITWQLQRKTSETTWANVGTPITTTMTLAAGAQDVYATSNGQATGNHDWGQDVIEQGTYKVIATVNSA